MYKQIQAFSSNTKTWIREHYLQLAIFNVTLILLELLRSAGYFEPLYLISINLIVFTALLMAIFLLEANSKAIFFISMIFLIVTQLFSAFHLVIWAERASIYFFESLFLAIALFIVENYISEKAHEKK